MKIEPLHVVYPNIPIIFRQVRLQVVFQHVFLIRIWMTLRRGACLEQWSLHAVNEAPSRGWREMTWSRHETVKVRSRLIHATQMFRRGTEKYPPFSRRKITSKASIPLVLPFFFFFFSLWAIKKWLCLATWLSSTLFWSYCTFTIQPSTEEAGMP